MLNTWLGGHTQNYGLAASISLINISMAVNIF